MALLFCIYMETTSKRGGKHMSDKAEETRNWLDTMPFDDNPRRIVPPEAQIASTWDEWIANGKRIPDIEKVLGRMLGTEENALTRSRAALALGFLGSHESGPILINSLASDVPSVQMEAAAALGRLGNDEAVEPLCEALRSADVNVRANASMALGRLGGERARECLNQVLQDNDPFVRTAATEALRVMNNR
jgi:HEAT repeat protein